VVTYLIQSSFFYIYWRCPHVLGFVSSKILTPHAEDRGCISLISYVYIPQMNRKTLIMNININSWKSSTN
jgi:hypothetical protein